MCWHRIYVDYFFQLLLKIDLELSFYSESTQLIRIDVLCGLFRNCKVIKHGLLVNVEHNGQNGNTLEWRHKLFILLSSLKILKSNHYNKS